MKRNNGEDTGEVASMFDNTEFEDFSKTIREDAPETEHIEAEAEEMPAGMVEYEEREDFSQRAEGPYRTAANTGYRMIADLKCQMCAYMSGGLPVEYDPYLEYDQSGRRCTGVHLPEELENSMGLLLQKSQVLIKPEWVAIGYLLYSLIFTGFAVMKNERKKKEAKAQA